MWQKHQALLLQQKRSHSNFYCRRTVHYAPIDVSNEVWPTSDRLPQYFGRPSLGNGLLDQSLGNSRNTPVEVQVYPTLQLKLAIRLTNPFRSAESHGLVASIPRNGVQYWPFSRVSQTEVPLAPTGHMQTPQFTRENHSAVCSQLDKHGTLQFLEYHKSRWVTSPSVQHYTKYLTCSRALAGPLFPVHNKLWKFPHFLLIVFVNLRGLYY